jgi:NH3-dependent NAD+ synthetase
MCLAVLHYCYCKERSALSSEISVGMEYRERDQCGFGVQRERSVWVWSTEREISVGLEYRERDQCGFGVQREGERERDVIELLYYYYHHHHHHHHHYMLP